MIKIRRKIAFLTATRAEYGKLKPIINIIREQNCFDYCIFVTGMHMLERFGSTYQEILLDKYANVVLDTSYSYTPNMDNALAHVVTEFSKFVQAQTPDMIIVHGDRLDALAGAIVGSFNNILVAHIEGGELSGTIDESIRHAVSKLSHIHLVSNSEAKRRLLQLGEKEETVFEIGSPDIDIMLGTTLPKLDDVLERYAIASPQYAILMYHPVVTELHLLEEYLRVLTLALLRARENFVVIFPNNDPGSEKITDAYEALKPNGRFRILPSMRFEHFLRLLKSAKYIIGNSSAGIREACVYGTPAIDIGSRQKARYSPETIKNVQHVEHDAEQLDRAIAQSSKFRISGTHFGAGNSAGILHALLMGDAIWQTPTQKAFVDLEM